jgi:hypothetical protein
MVWVFLNTNILPKKQQKGKTIAFITISATIKLVHFSNHNLGAVMPSFLTPHDYITLVCFLVGTIIFFLGLNRAAKGSPLVSYIGALSIFGGIGLQIDTKDPHNLVLAFSLAGLMAAGISLHCFLDLARLRRDLRKFSSTPRA